MLYWSIINVYKIGFDQSATYMKRVLANQITYIRCVDKSSE